MKERRGFVWPEERRCAVTLTYDDALPVQRKVAAPRLAALGMTATFYLDAGTGFTEHVEEWRAVAAMGHELGNHTLFHPGRREDIGPDSCLDEPYNLCDYSLRRWTDEIRIANCLLRLTDGQTERSFGNTYCQTTIGRTPREIELAGPILRHFVAGRGAYREAPITPEALNCGALGHLGGDRWSFERMRGHIEQAMDIGGWVIFMFHGIGPGEHAYFIEGVEHDRLIGYLDKRRTTIWTASVVQAVRHLKAAGYPPAAERNKDNAAVVCYK